jgi:hypothetical protein
MSGARLACPVELLGSSCHHMRELPEWELPLGGGHLAGNTHILIIVI